MSPAEQLADLIFDEANHLYHLGGRFVPGVTMVLEATGLIDYSFLGASRFRYLERGRLVHKATHEDDEGRLNESEYSEEVLGYVGGWRKFRFDYGFVPNRIEQRVCNRKRGYAGTLDRTGMCRDGSEIILDIKSGIAPKATRYQLAAYAACLLHPRTRRRRCIELHRDSTYRVIGYASGDYQRDYDTFCAALLLFNRMEGR